MAVNKIYPDATAALAGLLRDGMTVMSGGFGLCGIPAALIEAIRDSGARDLTVISNNAGIDDAGLGLLLATRQIRKMISSYVGENATFAAQYLAGELEIEFNPQGTLAERIRAGGAGIPAFFKIRKMISSYVGENATFAAQYLAGELDIEFNPQGTLAERIRAGGAGIPAFFTATGAGTDIAKGKPTEQFDGRLYVMERGLTADLAVIHAWKADPEGNLVFRKTARNFNPIMATAAKTTVVEVEELVASGQIDPDHIVTPGIFVDRIVRLARVDKRIEQRTVRTRS